MKNYFSMILVILAVAYLFSPVDFFPDSIPFLGILDDLSFIGILAYYLRYKKFPDFSKFKFTRPGTKGFSSKKSEKEEKNGGNYSPGPDVDLNDGKNPYEVLDIRPGASQAEIQKAYRKAVSKYHPDKLAHLGKDFQELARRKFLKIQKAYETLKK